MADPTWASRTLVDGADGIVYVQVEPSDGSNPAAVASGDMMAFVTELSVSGEAETSDRGPYLQYNVKKKSHSGNNFSGSFKADMAKGADTVYERWINAVENKTRLRITMVVTGGPTFVAKQCIPSYEFSGGASDGYATDFSFETDVVTHTAAS